MIGLLTMIPASIRLAGLAALAVAALAGLWRLHASIDAAGYARAQAECAAAVEETRRAHAAEVLRLADDASVSEARMLATRRTAEGMIDALRSHARPVCAVSDGDARGVRAVRDATTAPTGDPPPAPAAR